MIPSALTARTPSGGYHVYFEHLSGLKNIVKPIAGLDLRTDGGQVIAEGSTTPKGSYHWIDFNAAPLKLQTEFRDYLWAIAGEDKPSTIIPKPIATKPTVPILPAIVIGNRPAPDYSRCLFNAPKKSDGSVDYSRADSAFVVFALSHGYAPAEAASMLAAVSPLERKSNPEDYIQRTIASCSSYLARQVEAHQ